MDKFVLKHKWECGDETRLENSTEFESDCLYDEIPYTGILTRIEEFLRGSGFSFDGHLVIMEEEEYEKECE